MSFVPLFKIGYLISLIYQIRLYLISYILPVLKVVFDNVAVGPTAHVLWVGPTCLFLLYIFPPSLLPPPMPVGVLRPPALTRASCYYGHLRVTRPRCCRCGCGHLRTTCPWRCPPPLPRMLCWHDGRPRVALCSTGFVPPIPATSRRRRERGRRRYVGPTITSSKTISKLERDKK